MLDRLNQTIDLFRRTQVADPQQVRDLLDEMLCVMLLMAREIDDAKLKPSKELVGAKGVIP